MPLQGRPTVRNSYIAPSGFGDQMDLIFGGVRVGDGARERYIYGRCRLLPAASEGLSLLPAVQSFRFRRSGRSGSPPR